MINLLPPDVKENIVYARRNAHLRKWVAALFAGILCVVAIVGVGHIYLQQSVKSYSKIVAEGNKNLQVQKLEDTQKRVQDLSDSLKLVVQVLQREILFSKLLAQVGAALPNGSVLTDLDINKVQGGLDLQAAARDYHTATQVQLNLQDPQNKIFEKADIVNIQCAAAKPTGGDPLLNQYPCTVKLRALFSKNNTFSFIDKTTTPEVKP